MLVVVAIVARRRWRRLGVVVLAAGAGAALFALLDALFDVGGSVRGAVTDGTWVASTDFPSLVYVAGAGAVVTVGKPWLRRSWRRCADLSLLVLVVVLAVAGTAGVPELLVAVAAGVTAGAAVLVALGAPNRRPTPSAVVGALRAGGLAVDELALERADGGRAQLYTAALDGGDRAFVKVYARDSRDADLLYRGYRTALLQGAERRLARDDARAGRRARSAAPAHGAAGRRELPGAAVALRPRRRLDGAGRRVRRGPPAGCVAGRRDRRRPAGPRVAPGRTTARRAPRAPLAARRQHPGDRGRARRDRLRIRHRVGGRAGRRRSTAPSSSSPSPPSSGPSPSLASAARTIGVDALAGAAPYLQPLALSAATRKQASKAVLRELRDGIAATTGEAPAPLEQLVRVRARTLVMIAALSAAFYVLLPQLADVGDSVDALGSANWWWLAVCVVMSIGTYLFAAVGLSGGVPEHLPFVPNLAAQMASSFVNRVTPANVGGMALNLRFLQKAGVAPAEAVTGIGLNVAAGGLAHLLLLVMFVAWAGQSDTESFKIPSSSKLLVVIAVVLAVVGLIASTRWGRRVVLSRVVKFLRDSLASLIVLAHSPAKIAALAGGSIGVSMAYICALAAAVAAFDGGVSFAQVGAVYLGASMIAAAAPTPGGLGAMEAALVAGLTGVGMEPSIAVAAVLSYRLLTYWLPVLPGWLSFHYLERRDFI